MTTTDPEPTDTRPGTPDGVTGTWWTRNAWCGHVIAVGLIIVAAVLFMNPIFRGKTFSTVPGHQNVLLPWAAQPNGGSDIFPQSDQADTFHPFTVFADREIHDGDIPLWNPDTFGGTPFLANGITGLLDPVRLGLMATTSPSWVHDLLILSRLILMGTAMYLLCWHLGLRRIPSLLAAVAWQFSSFTAGWLQLETFAVAAVAIPLGIVLIDRVIARPTATRAWIAAALLGVMVVSTNIQSAVVVAVVLALYTLPTLLMSLRHQKEPLRFLGRRLIALVGVAAGAALVASPLMLATAQILGHTSRSPQSLDILMHAGRVPMRQIISSTFSAPETPPNVGTLHRLAYVGIITAVLAVLGVVLRSRASTIGRWFALVTLLVASGTVVTHIAYVILPGLSSFQHLGRLLFLWSFGVVLLAASALDRLMTVALRWIDGRRDRWSPAALARLRGIALALASLIVIITAWDVARVARGLNPPFLPRTSANLYPETPAIRAVRKSLAETGGMLLPLTYSRTAEAPFTSPVFYGSSSMLYTGIRSVAGYESLAPRRVTDFWRLFNGEAPSEIDAVAMTAGYIPVYTSATVRFEMLPATAISVILGPPALESDPAWRAAIARKRLRVRITYRGPDGVVAEVLDAGPRARVVFDAVPAGDEKAAVGRVEALDDSALTTAVIEAPAGDAPTTAPADGRPLPATVVDHGPDRVDVEVRSPRRGWLVLADSWAPGWSAEVNGRPAPIRIANAAQRSVAIPSGTSHVTFVYRPAGWPWAPLAALAFIVAGGAAVLIGHIRTRRTPHPADTTTDPAV